MGGIRTKLEERKRIPRTARGITPKDAAVLLTSTMTTELAAERTIEATPMR
jgi:hypothetical protein